MALRERFVSADIQEDIKIMKVFPMGALKWLIAVFIISIIVSFIFFGPIMRIVFVIGSSFMTVFIFSADIPNQTRKVKSYFSSKHKIKNFNSVIGIDEFDAISKKDSKEMVFLEYEVEPWEVSEEGTKEAKARKFAQDVMAAVSLGGEVSIYATCSSEDTNVLERRLENLENLSGGVKKLENNRIEHHYKLSRFASKTKYKIRIERDTKKNIEEEVEDIGEMISFDGQVIGGDSVKEYIKNQLTPDSKIKRGKGGDIND
ncbi:hypothetical protein [Sporosalibacterium faouarense]|uniref:hypothetical protein n=1 Tax=Sporosalibacterium faouarense TaxID=516123 RepID=UPI00192BFC38|nr:hypothetical protein [Sporosalibacterium faouarense]